MEWMFYISFMYIWERNRKGSTQKIVALAKNQRKKVEQQQRRAGHVPAKHATIHHAIPFCSVRRAARVARTANRSSQRVLSLICMATRLAIGGTAVRGRDARGSRGAGRRGSRCASSSRVRCARTNGARLNAAPAAQTIYLLARVRGASSTSSIEL